MGQKKISLAKIFSFKSKDKFVEDVQGKLTKKEFELNNTEALLALVMIRLVEKEIPEFKRGRIGFYKTMQDQYNEILQKSLETLKDSAKATISHLK